jgi:hypothetical protein
MLGPVPPAKLVRRLPAPAPPNPEPRPFPRAPNPDGAAVAANGDLSVLLKAALKAEAAAAADAKVGGLFFSVAAPKGDLAGLLALRAPNGDAEELERALNPEDANALAEV